MRLPCVCCGRSVKAVTLRYGSPMSVGSDDTLNANICTHCMKVATKDRGPRKGATFRAAPVFYVYSSRYTARILGLPDSVKTALALTEDLS